MSTLWVFKPTFIYSLGCLERSFKHIHIIINLKKVSKQMFIYTSCEHSVTLSFICSHVCAQLTKVKSNIYSPFSSWGKYLALQLQWVLLLILLVLLPVYLISSVRVNQNSKVAGCKTRCAVELRENEESGQITPDTFHNNGGLFFPLCQYKNTD